MKSKRFISLTSLLQLKLHLTFLIAWFFEL